MRELYFAVFRFNNDNNVYHDDYDNGGTGNNNTE